MPYYSELGIYTSPSGSTYSPSFLKGPYASHSSIVANNYALPARGVRPFKPLLTTISEGRGRSPLARVASPKALLYHTSPKLNVGPPPRAAIKQFNTADIDVSVNKYERSRKAAAPRRPSPKESPEEQKEPGGEATAGEIRRDRPTVRLKTDRSVKTWRDNFSPSELKSGEVKVRKKSPGEILKEKFLIRSRSKEKILDCVAAKRPLKKSPSFHDICTAISSDAVFEDLNNQRRNSGSGSLLQQEILEELAGDSKKARRVESPEDRPEDGQGVKRRPSAKASKGKPYTRRKSTLKDILQAESGTGDLFNAEPHASSTTKSPAVAQHLKKAKPKPIITSSVGEIEEKPNLKVHVEEIQVSESPKPKKKREFTFSVVVEEARKESLKRVCAKVPKSKTPIVATLSPKKVPFYVGKVLNEKEQLRKSTNVNKISLSKSSDQVVKPKFQIEETAIGKSNSASDIVSKMGKTSARFRDVFQNNSDIAKNNAESNAVLNDKSSLPFNKSEQCSVANIKQKSGTVLLEKSRSSTKVDNLENHSGQSEKVKIDNSTRPLLKTSLTNESKTVSQEKHDSNVIESDNAANGAIEKTVSGVSLLNKRKTDVLEPPSEQPKQITELKPRTESKTSEPKKTTREISNTVKECENIQKTDGYTPETNTGDITAINKVPDSPQKSKNKTNEPTKQIKDISKTDQKSEIISDQITNGATEENKANSIAANDKSNKVPDSVQKVKSKTNEPKKQTADEKPNQKPGGSAPENKISDAPRKVDVPAKTKLETKRKESAADSKTAQKSASLKTDKEKVSNAAVTRVSDISKAVAEKPLSNADSVDSNDSGVNFWDSLEDQSDSLSTPRPIKLETKDPRSLLAEIQEAAPAKPVSKRSLIKKATKHDPDLHGMFEPPEPEPEVAQEEAVEGFVPLQSNRFSQWMHPWQKPKQLEVSQLELYARPKVIRARHVPRRYRTAAAEDEDGTSSAESDGEEEDDSEEETDDGNESEGSDYSDCDVNCHKKCERLTANLCGVNQKLIAEAVQSLGDLNGSLGSGGGGGGRGPAGAAEAGAAAPPPPPPPEYADSSTYGAFRRTGRVTPPATTIPRFRKYCVDDFNFLKVLGKGNFGKVLLAELKGTDYYYAIKCLKKDVVLEDDDIECTLIERKVLALGTKHPYLCHLLCTFQTESHLFFVMEYLNGGDLMFHIQNTRRFSEERARFYAAEISSGLKFLHNKGIVYRDLKLDNILLDFDGHARIADFGMCKLQIFLDRMADTFCGTPDYMAPEIIKGQHYNQCVDWWSFGVLLYEMLIGSSPFSGCDEDELFWSICNEKPVIPKFLSKEANSILVQLMEKDANNRLGNRYSPYGDIRDHVFFKSIDWQALEERRLEPPFKPDLKHPLDTQYFDKIFTKEPAKLTPIETTILSSMDQTQFQGFSYTNPNATDV